MGQVLVNGVVLVIIFGVALIARELVDVGWPVAILIGVPFGWLWWSFSVPRWRHWALSRGVDAQALQRLAQRTGLVWAEDSIVTKTEIRHPRK